MTLNIPIQYLMSFEEGGGVYYQEVSSRGNSQWKE